MNRTAKYFADPVAMLDDAVASEKPITLKFISKRDAHKYRQRLYRARALEIERAVTDDPLYAEQHPYKYLTFTLDGLKLTVYNSWNADIPLVEVV